LYELFFVQSEVVCNKLVRGIRPPTEQEQECAQNKYLIIIGQEIIFQEIVKNNRLI
jgi:hypothetical protein